MSAVTTEEMASKFLDFFRDVGDSMRATPDLPQLNLRSTFNNYDFGISQRQCRSARRGALPPSATYRIGMRGLAESFELLGRVGCLIIQHVLTSAYTTANIDFIKWNKAFSIFPRQTLMYHEFYPLRALG